MATRRRFSLNPLDTGINAAKMALCHSRHRGKQMFNPSPEQLAIFQELQSGKDHLIIEAVAGSGKTTTIIRAILDYLQGERVAVAAFNRAIADEVKAKLGYVPGVFANTVHGFGYQVWRAVNLVVKFDERVKKK